MSDSVTSWTAAHQACLSLIVSGSLPKFMSIESVMPSNHLILCYTLLHCLQSFPASGSFPMNRLFASCGQSIGASASALVLPMSIQGSFPLGLTGLILQSKGLSRVFSSTILRWPDNLETTERIKAAWRNSLAVQWVGLVTFTARSLDLIPYVGTKIFQAAWSAHTHTQHTKPTEDWNCMLPSLNLLSIYQPYQLGLLDNPELPQGWVSSITCVSQMYWPTQDGYQGINELNWFLSGFPLRRR